MNLWNEKTLQDKTPEQQAATAIATVLHLVRSDPILGFRINIGGKSFSELTEAASTLWGEPVEEVRRRFAHPKGIDPVRTLKKIRELVEEQKPPVCGKYPCGECVWCVATMTIQGAHW